MNRMGTVAALAAAALALPAAAAAHKADPNYLTEVRSIRPPDGITVTVLNRSDALLLHNRSGEDVVIEGYDGDPYARVLADGTVEVNTNSRAHYLNQDRFGTTKPPPGVTKGAPPKWRRLDGTGRFQWHDHRMHWMGRNRPPQVTDPGVRTKIYDWTVPIEVGGAKGAIAGTLFWTPRPGGGPPAAALVAGGVIVLGLVLLVIAVRRRRASPPAEREAW